MPKKCYEVTITPLTGVHIGSGNQLSFMDYTIYEDKIYTRIMGEQVISKIFSDKNKMIKFDEVTRKNNMRELQKFFNDNFIFPDDAQYICAFTKEFKRKFEQNKQKDPKENAALVEEIYRPEGSSHPVIPGSSLKGAIRTAIIDSFVTDDNYEAAKKERRLENFLLENKNERDDPFRCIRISDCEFASQKTQLVGLMKNISKIEAKNELKEIEKLQIQAEIIRGELTGKFAPATTRFVIDEDLQKAKTDKFSIEKKISMEKIRKSCNVFYLDEFDSEYDNFYKGIYDDNVDLISELKKELEKIEKDESSFVIRVGRWSQVESVTLPDFMNPKVPTRKGSEPKWGTTRTVFDLDGKYLPLGWCKCTFKEVSIS